MSVRSINITGGDRDYVWIDITDAAGNDITADALQLGFSGWEDPPAAPFTPSGASDVVQHPSPSTVRVGVFVAGTAGPDGPDSDGAHIVTPDGVRYVWARLTGDPESAWVRCGVVRFD